MEDNGCPNDAAFIVPWGGKLYKYCMVHANALCAIGNVIGSPIEVQPVMTEHQCEGLDDLDELTPKKKG